MTATADAGGVTIRRAEPGDLSAVLRIEEAAFPQPWPPDAFRGFLGEPGFLVADAEGTVAGYVVADVATTRGVEVGHVKDLAVAPDRRRQGIGAVLLERGLDALLDQGVRRAKLEVRQGNDPARALYEGFGFEVRRRLPGYYADGEDALVLVVEL